MALTASGFCLHHGTYEDRGADLTAAVEEAEKRRRKHEQRVGDRHLRALSDIKVRQASQRRRDHRNGIAGLLILSLLATGFVWYLWRDHHHDEKCAHMRAAWFSPKRASDEVHIPVTADALAHSLDFGEETRWPATEQGIKDAYAYKHQLAGKAASIALKDTACFSSDEIDEAQAAQNSPLSVSWVEMPWPAGSCADGWISPSIGRQGACSHHGGIATEHYFAVLHFDSQ
jgi:hypothetical protein